MSVIADPETWVNVIGSPVAQAVGWALLQFVWQGAVIGAIAALAIAALRHSAADVRYVVSTIALSLMLTIPAVTAWQGVSAARERSAPVVPPRAVSTVVPAPEGVRAIRTPSVPATLAGKVPASFSGQVPATFWRRVPATFSGQVPATWASWLLLGWTLGVFVLTLRLLTGWLWVQRLRTHGACPARAPIRESVHRLARQLHVLRRVRVLESTLVDVPTVVGWLKPVILLPVSALAGLSPVQLEAVLAHELAHIRRHDYLVNLLQTLVETLLFYHPAVWWVSRQIRIERENCCDDLAVGLCGDAVVYAQALADLEELRAPTGHCAHLTLAANGGSLINRVRRVLGAPSHAGHRPGWLAGVVSVVVIVTMAGVLARAIDRDVRHSEAAQRQAAVDRQTDDASMLAAAADGSRWAANQVRRAADELRREANTLRRGANELRRGANEVRRGVDEVRRDADDLRRMAPVVATRLGRMAQDFVRDLQRTSHALAASLHEAFPQIPPPPPLPPEPPSPPDAPLPPPPSPADAPLPPEPASLPAPSLPPAFPVVPPSVPDPPAPPSPPVPPSLPAPGGEALPRDGQQRGTFTWSNDGQKLEVEYRGQIEFTDDDVDVKSLSPGGYLRIRSQNKGETRRTIEFRADGSGRVDRRFWSGTSERPFEPEGRAWLAQVLPRFIRQTGIGAEARVARIFKSKGAQGVLAEISLIEGSWAKRVYFAELLDTPGLDPRTTQQALAQASREIDSDFELASLLISVDSLPSDDATRRAYVDAARSIDSDFEMRRVFSSALKRGPLSPAMVAAILDAGIAIGSDFEQASLLLDVARLQPLDDSTRGAFFKALGTIGSDFEQRRVLSAVMKRSDVSPAVIGAAVEVAGSNIDSDFELASVLLEVARSQSIEGALRAPFFRAVATIGSTFERGRVLQAVAKRPDASESTIWAVIKATEGMGGSFETAQVLLAVSAAHPLTGEARGAYIDASERLGDFEQGRVLSALVKNDRSKR